MGEIRDLLIKIGAISDADLEVYSERTRDREKLTVHRDRRTEVVFIDGFYVGEQEYAAGLHRAQLANLIGVPDWERYNDTTRRLHDFERFFVGKGVVDFGCGRGHFLRAVQGRAKSIMGVEIDQKCLENLKNEHIPAAKNLYGLATEATDTIACFHVLEHLQSPIETLTEMHRILKPNGILIVEVPHARDFLLAGLGNEAYKAFTLWSQHLILHTRSSLEALLSHAGFDAISTKAVQRYPLSNHLGWLSQGKPGGHKSRLSLVDTDPLTREYEAALAKLDMTDTLVSIAQKCSA